MASPHEVVTTSEGNSVAAAGKVETCDHPLQASYIKVNISLPDSSLHTSQIRANVMLLTKILWMVS